MFKQFNVVMKLSLLVLSILLMGVAANAQRGTTEIGVGAEAGLPLGDFGKGFKAGFGGYAKALFGVGFAGQVTATTGYSAFTAKGSSTEEKVTLYLVPILAGYRQNFNGFYVEPQAGIGIYGAKVKVMGESASSSETKFTWAAGVGYEKNSIDIGVRYQRGEFEGGSISMVGIRVGYNFQISK